MAILIFQYGYSEIAGIAEDLGLKLKDSGKDALSRQAEIRNYHRDRSERIAAANYSSRLSAAMENKEKASYGAGILDSTDTITGPIKSNDLEPRVF